MAAIAITIAASGDGAAEHREAATADGGDGGLMLGGLADGAALFAQLALGLGHLGS